MRSRLLVLFALVMAVAAGLASPASAAITFAQAESEEGADQSDAGTDTEGGGESEGGEDAETGAGEGEQAPAAEEEGPQWTYQMSKITLVMMLLLCLALGALYYRMIARRQRGV